MWSGVSGGRGGRKGRECGRGGGEEGRALPLPEILIRINGFGEGERERERERERDRGWIIFSLVNNSEHM